MADNPWRIPDDCPPETRALLQRVLDDIYGYFQLGARVTEYGRLDCLIPGSTVLKDVSVGTSETAVEHKMRETPFGWVCLRKDTVGPWDNQAPDTKYLYLIAAAATVCDLWVIPQIVKPAA